MEELRKYWPSSVHVNCLADSSQVMALSIWSKLLKKPLQYREVELLIIHNDLSDESYMDVIGEPMYQAILIFHWILNGKVTAYFLLV